MTDPDHETFRRRSQALGDPTRHAIYRWMAEVAGPVAVADVVAEFGLNHNTVRQHLSKLRSADLVLEEQGPPRGPGRPRMLYRLTAEAAAEWNDEAPYQRLALMLLDLAASGLSPEEVGARVSTAALDTLPEGGDVVAALAAAMADQGFAPRVVRRAGKEEIVLDHCPFAAAAEAHPEVVCALHRGMARGTAEALGGSASVRLTPRPPRRAGCRLEVSSPST